MSGTEPSKPPLLQRPLVSVVLASRDGQRFLIIDPSQDPAASPMNVLLNWHAQGERR